MPADSQRQFSYVRMGAACTYPPEILPLLQSLLAILADLDFEHESDVQTVRESSADEWLKQTTIQKLQERHHERRASYVRKLESLPRQTQAQAA